MRAVVRRGCMAAASRSPGAVKGARRCLTTLSHAFRPSYDVKLCRRGCRRPWYSAASFSTESAAASSKPGTFEASCAEAEEGLRVLKMQTDTESLRRRIQEIDHAVAQPEAYTSEGSSVTKLLKERASLDHKVSSMADLEMELDSCREMYALAASEGEAELLAECTAAASALAARAQKLKVTALLSALGDAADASAYVEVTAGAGGLEAALWASMLVKMYSKWAQAKNYSVRLDAEHKVEGSTGVKSATLVIDGQQAYGWLSMEAGVHRMVRMALGKRQTSFAQVQVYPVIDDELKLSGIELPASDLRIETMRSQGAGGQHVNTTDSAVRLTHIPTGTQAMCQDERSQHRNKDKAMQILRGKLYAQAQAERLAQRQQQRASLGDNSWGNQIRSYVLAPYQMVKDHRTQEETGDVEAVLEHGEIDNFIESALASGLSEEGG